MAINENYGIGMGLLNGINQAIASYQDAKDKRASQDIQLAGLGLKRDNSGNFVQDPELLKQKRLAEQNKQIAESASHGVGLKYDDRGNLLTTPEEIRQQSLDFLKQQEKAKRDPLADIVKQIEIQKGREDLSEKQRKTQEVAAAKQNASQAIQELQNQPTGLLDRAKNFIFGNPAAEKLKASLPGFIQDKDQQKAATGLLPGRVSSGDLSALASQYGLPSSKNPVEPASAVKVDPHPQDSQAIAWAKSNPNDPRAKKIMMRFQSGVAQNGQ